MYQPAYQLIDDSHGISDAGKLYNQFMPKLAPYVPEDVQKSASIEATHGFPVSAISYALGDIEIPIPRALADELSAAYKGLRPEEGAWYDIPWLVEDLDETYGLIASE